MKKPKEIIELEELIEICQKNFYKKHKNTSCKNIEFDIYTNKLELDYLDYSVNLNNNFDYNFYQIDDNGCINSIKISIDIPIEEDIIIKLLEFKYLKKLHLVDNEIIDISFLKDFDKLEVLNLRKNKINNIKVLSDLKNLKKIILRENRISDISVLNDFEELKSLDLKDNNIKDIEPLFKHIKKGLKIINLNLKKEFLDENEIILENNPIEYPPLEILEYDNDYIINWIEENTK